MIIDANMEHDHRRKMIIDGGIHVDC